MPQPRSNQRVRVAALGYYGFGNLGDEAVLAGIRRALATELETDFLVLSNNPTETQRLHPGVEAANRWKWREAAQALRGTDLFVFGGGSLLQDATSARSVVWYALMALLARRLSRRVLWWGQGIGPLNTNLSRRLVGLIANQADALTVRDENSAQLLKEVGARRVIQSVADPAFALEPAHPVPDIPRFPAVLLSLRSWKSDEFSRRLHGVNLGAEMSYIAEGDTEVLPMHLPEDAEYAKHVLEIRTRIHDWRAAGGSVEQTLGRFRHARFVVAMRLHALIFAARCAVPFIALNYDPKVAALANAAGQGDTLLPLDTTIEALIETARRVRATEPERREQLREFAQEQSKAARIPAQLARELLG